MTDTYLHWKAWHASEFGRAASTDTSYFDHELAKSGIRSVRGLTVGELGFGNGGFAQWVRQAGGYWTGREANPELSRRAADAGFSVLNPDERFSDRGRQNAFDLIVAFDVVEHLELGDVRGFLVDAWAALKPGGRLIFRIPSGDSPFSGAIYNGDITHRSFFGSSAIRRLALEAKLEVVQIRSPVLPAADLGPIHSLRRLAAGAVQAVAFAFIRNILMGNSGAVVSPNMVVVLCRRADA
jgi:SAM-dependent methyltransferase